MIFLLKVRNSNQQLRALMKNHYSKPLGFVGRNICYLVFWIDPLKLRPNNIHCFGAIVAGSATRHLVGRSNVLGNLGLEYIVNNTFYHVEPSVKYPCRNFTSRVLTEFRKTVSGDWEKKYGDPVIGFETLVELPRSGECYRRDGWVEVGVTKGYTCKRTAGRGSDSWSGRRVWDTKNLRPKRVFVRIA